MAAAVTRLAPEERRQRIAEMLRHGRISVARLGRELRISEMTVRRDLDALEREGKLERVHGGALPNDRLAYEFSFKEKESQNREAKEEIGQLAAGLVRPGDAVFLDAGTTAVSIARALRVVKPSLIVTINLRAALESAGQKGVQVFVPGGELRAASPEVYGETTVEILSRINVDVAFLGCDAVDVNAFYSTDMRSPAVSRMVMSHSRQAYLAADSSKFGHRSMCVIAPLQGLTGVITDSRLCGDQKSLMGKHGVKLLEAELTH